MRITTETLQARGACQDGIDAFAAEFPGGLDVREWTAECQIGMMMHPALRRYIGWAWRFGIMPQWSMRGWSLAGADLARADLASAYLARANLARAYLARADLAGANLAGANLTGADLTGANLARAYLAGADLAGADLAGADLTGARWDFMPPPPAGWICVGGLLRRDR